MALTPTNSRMSLGPWGLRITPSNSSKAVVKSGKSNRVPDNPLSLRHVIGTTANSPNAIGTLPAAGKLAFTAGAAAVICDFDDKLNFTQRFYRARPTALPLNPTPTIYSPSTPTSQTPDFRTRTARESVVGGSPFASSSTDWSDSPGGKSRTARDRVKAATCVSFSPDGKYLAVGETGYKPRVLIFSTSKESSPDSPLTCLPDHYFGVRSVSFSPNSQYLASLGAANDGYLYIWTINNRNGAASLFASNKCTSNIAQIAWIGTNLITVGTRHVKVWRIEGSSVSTPIKTAASALLNTNSHKVLVGRNCLLGPLLEGIFTSVVAISPSHAIVGSDSGDICLLDDAEGCQRFTKVFNAGFGITALTLNPNGEVVVAGPDNQIRCFGKERLLSRSRQSSISIDEQDRGQSNASFVAAMARLGKHIVTVDDRRVIRILDPPIADEPNSETVSLQLPAHGGAVLGVRPLALGDSASFFTWSADGTILFWNLQGICKKQISVELEQNEEADDSTVNELRVVRACATARALITGDKLGVLRVVDEDSGRCTFSIRAHAGEITDVAVYERGEVLVASSGRDRSVQVFRKLPNAWELQQTLDEHVGAVTGLLFTSDGKHLLSCSSDRTVVVREALSRHENGERLTAFTILRTITLKATPVSMALLADRDDSLLISAVDRTVQKYNLHTGHQNSTFKASDLEGGEAVVLSSLIHLCSANGQNILAGVSSTDKSLRLYDEKGTFIGRDWGHTEGVTDLTTINTKPREDLDSQKSLVTVAADGTVFIWSYGNNSTKTNPRRDISQSMELMGASNLMDIPPRLISSKPPLRRVLSQSEMARFRQSSPEQEDTPTSKRPHRPLEKRPSRNRFSLAQTPRLDPSPMTTVSGIDNARRKSRRSPSPPPPSPQRPRTIGRKPSLESSKIRARPSVGSASASSAELSHSTDFICRTLRSYRKKLASSNEVLPPETLRELERELGLTARAVGERAIKAKGKVEEGMMVKLLSQYSERLIEMLDERFKTMGTSSGNSAASGSEEDITGAISNLEIRETVEEHEDEAQAPPRAMVNGIVS